jgi:hypothetical protein
MRKLALLQIDKQMLALQEQKRSTRAGESLALGWTPGPAPKRRKTNKQRAIRQAAPDVESLSDLDGK